MNTFLFLQSTKLENLRFMQAHAPLDVGIEELGENAVAKTGGGVRDSFWDSLLDDGDSQEGSSEHPRSNGQYSGHQLDTFQVHNKHKDTSCMI